MFAEFWSKYPRKEAKKAAEKAWNKLSDEDRRKAIEVLPSHCRRWDDPQYIPLPGSWLNGARFDDELPEIVNRKQTVSDSRAAAARSIFGVKNDVIDIAAARRLD